MLDLEQYIIRVRARRDEAKLPGGYLPLETRGLIIGERVMGQGISSKGARAVAQAERVYQGK